MYDINRPKTFLSSNNFFLVALSRFNPLSANVKQHYFSHLHHHHKNHHSFVLTLNPEPLIFLYHGTTLNTTDFHFLAPQLESFLRNATASSSTSLSSLEKSGMMLCSSLNHNDGCAITPSSCARNIKIYHVPDFELLWMPFVSYQYEICNKNP